ncbi:HNH endonuclease [bacterium]|nr:HNH endonuclease [bacterium]
MTGCLTFNPPVLFAAAIERLYDLHVGTTPVEEGTPHEKPHKPLLLLAAFDLIDEGLATPERIPWCQQLRDRFTARFLLDDVSFIDAAHLIPFSESQNDHPTNGLALCKNHHWAMDRNLIAPAPDHHWHVSRILDPRRSNGEKELNTLSGQSLLLPQDQAFHPDAEGLKWRSERLIA